MDKECDGEYPWMDWPTWDYNRIGVVAYHLKLHEIFRFHNAFQVPLLSPHNVDNMAKPLPPPLIENEDIIHEVECELQLKVRRINPVMWNSTSWSGSGYGLKHNSWGLEVDMSHEVFKECWDYVARLSEHLSPHGVECNHRIVAPKEHQHILLNVSPLGFGDASRHVTTTFWFVTFGMLCHRFTKPLIFSISPCDCYCKHP